MLNGVTNCLHCKMQLGSGPAPSLSRWMGVELHFPHRWLRFRSMDRNFLRLGPLSSRRSFISFTSSNSISQRWLIQSMDRRPFITTQKKSHRSCKMIQIDWTGKPEDSDESPSQDKIHGGGCNSTNHNSIFFFYVQNWKGMECCWGTKIYRRVLYNERMSDAPVPCTREFLGLFIRLGPNWCYCGALSKKKKKKKPK